MLRDLWLDGHYRAVIGWVKKNKKTSGVVESIRLVFAHYDRDGERVGDVAQSRAIDADIATWETYAVHVLPGEASEMITGFLLRIRRKT